MLHLLQLEWKKVRHYNTFRVLCALYLLLLPSLMMIGKNFSGLPDEIGSVESVYMFPKIWGWLGYIGNWLVFFFLGFLAVLSVTTEFRNKTLRQNIITGVSRTQYFLSKFYFIVAISAVATLYFTLCGMLIGYFHTETIYMSKVFQEISLVPRYFLMCVSYMSFGLLLGLLIRRTGIALFLYICYVMFLELIIRWGIHFQILEHRSMLFYPMNANEDLTPIPFLEMAENFMEKEGFSMVLTPTEAAITTIIYTIVFAWAGFRLLKRANL